MSREAGPRSGVADRVVFAAQFARAPLATASVWPSSPALAAAVADAALAGVPADRPAVVVELGAGSGAFTDALVARAPTGTRLLAVELNATLARRLAARHAAPGAGATTVEVVTADAGDLSGLLDDRGLDAADVVVSGLGWSATRPGRPDSLVGPVARALTPTGRFVQFCYTWTRWAGPAKALRADLDAAFARVEDTGTVWANLPPAAVLRAVGPRSDGRADPHRP